MQRTVLGTLTLAGIFAIATLDNWAAAQSYDPMPIDDAESYESELPQPSSESEIAERPKDYSKPYLGVTFDPNVTDAAVTRSVNAGSPADQAGLRAGDTLVSINGRRIGTYQEALRIIGELKVGEILDMDISRRVSLHSRAVLDGHPLDGEPTSVYRMESEVLPIPADIQVRPRTAAPRYNTNPPRPPQTNNPSVNRRNETTRNNNTNDRNNRSRGRAPRRR